MTYTTLSAFLLGAIAQAVFTVCFCVWQDWRENKKDKDHDQESNS